MSKRKQPEEDGSSSDVEVEESDYERLRRENIARNEAFLSAIGLDSTANVMRSEVAAQKRSQRGVSRMKRPASVAPSRRSGRVTVERLRVELEGLAEDDPSRKQKLADYESLLSSKTEATYAAVLNAADEREVYERIAEKELSALEPVNKPEDAGLDWGLPILSRLASASAEGGKNAKKKASSPDSSYAERIKGLKVREEDVAKLTEHRGTSVWFHPTESSLILAAGDKAGNFALWDLGASETGVDGVFKYKPHVSNICRIWGDGRIFTASYDGTIRYLDASSSKNAFILAHTCQDSTMDDMYYTDAAPSNTSTEVVYLTRSDGFLCAVDLRAGGDKYAFKHSTTFQAEGSVTVDGGKMNSIQEHPGREKTLVTAGNKGAVCLFDVRVAGAKSGAIKAVTALLGHTKSINAAHVSPDGEVVVSVSQDNTIKSWTGALVGGASIRSHSLSHDNHTGRWLSTFRPIWDPKQPAALISGSMAQPRCIEVFTASSSKGGISLSLVHKLKGDFLGSVCSRNAAHPSLDVVAGFNSSGRVHVFR
jgi:hypothetical protein